MENMSQEADKIKQAEKAYEEFVSSVPIGTEEYMNGFEVGFKAAYLLQEGLVVALLKAVQ